MPKEVAPVPLAEESVYSLIPPSQLKKQEQRMYRSKHAASAAVPPTCSTFGFQGTSKVCGNVAGKTANEDPESHPAIKSVGGMGRSVHDECDPRNFLKRTSATTVKVAGNPAAGGAAGGSQKAKSPPRGAAADSTSAAAAAGGSHRIHNTVRAPVPTRSEKPVLGLHSGKNFVAENAVSIAGAHPKAQAEEVRAVDGNDFGKVPQYLRDIKNGLQNEKNKKSSRVAAVATAVDYDELSSSEAQDLRVGLQRRWDELSRQIKSLPFKLETRSQIRRKEVLEQDFAAVEAAMQKMSRKRILIMK